MATSISFLPHTVLSPPYGTQPEHPDPYTLFSGEPTSGIYQFISPSFAPRLPWPGSDWDRSRFPDPENTGRLIGDLFARAEGLVYTIADAAVSASPESVSNTKQNNDWLSGIANYMETVLKVLKNGLSTVHTPYAYGFAIILLTILVKAATFPLSKKQVESAMAMRSLQPQIKAIQQRYAGDQERLQLETARLYKLAGINPLAGCLPTLATIPIWIGLYRALSNVADEGLLTEGFFWIPSLSGPTTIAARQSGGGISWLFPFIDGQPPLGWHDTLAYLVLPVLLVISQYISVQVMQSMQPQSDDPNLKTSQAITKFLPLMIGYFSLSVPSGLSLYWFTNNILSTAQQVWLQKMGGANNPVKQLGNDIIGNGEQSKMLKSVFETTAVEEAPKIEKPTSEGPRPDLDSSKELEARKRRQKEEEQRKAKVAATKEVAVTNGDVKKESDIERRVNGESAYAESKQDQETSIPRLENGEAPGNYNDRRDQQQHLSENPEKEKAVTSIGAAENKLGCEDKHQDRSE